jgi:high-affinity nickel-transport protein
MFLLQLADGGHPPRTLPAGATAGEWPPAARACTVPMPDYVHVARAAAVPGRRPDVLSGTDWLHLAGLYGFVGILHVAGWGLYLCYAAEFPALVGLGLVAYLFGLRHAFDADHIAAIDDTVRYMLQKGRRPLGVGFFFSLGHSTIVLCLAVGIGVAAVAVKEQLPQAGNVGGLIGATVSGTFLWIIGGLNLLVLLDILGVWRKAKAGTHDHGHLEELLAKRGLLNRLFRGRLQKTLNHSWQMYPLGLLFGLGFDTATEVGLLAMTAGASAGNLPLPAVLCLPILFAAGMTLMDTTDGVLMVKAYHWAFVNPLRRIFYNLATTSMSVAAALAIGTIELAQVTIEVLGLKGPVAGFIAGIEFGVLGYVIAGLFLVAWGASAAMWKLGRIEQRYGGPALMHDHPHTHAGGVLHWHRHMHAGRDAVTHSHSHPHPH